VTARHLPGADKALVEQRRIVEYLLNATHREGGPKAKFFLKRGFAIASWVSFADALVAHAKNNLVASVSEDKWGVRYRVECNLQTPDGLNPCIRAVWLMEKGAKIPRLITAHPF